MPTFQPRELIADRFRVREKIGAGGQGEVYLVEDSTAANAQCALKTLRSGFIPKDLARLRQEVQALQRIQSPRVLPFMATNLDTYEPSSKTPPFFVTAWARHGTLRQHDYFRKDIDLCLRLFRCVCEGVQAAHDQGVIHRDLKPSNILLLDDERDIRVGDFGLCRLALEEPTQESQITSIREMVGPLYFAAPEQTSLPATSTVRSDIYSLGRTLHYMITGVYEQEPAGEYSPVTAAIGLSQPHVVDELIRHMTRFDPKDRPASVAKVVEQIDRLLGIQPEEPKAKPELRLTKTQRRILKFLKSHQTSSVSLSKILKYIASFYVIDHTPRWLLSSYLTDVSGRISWADLAERVETLLEQLEQAGFVEFRYGKYSVTEKE